MDPTNQIKVIFGDLLMQVAALQATIEMLTKENQELKESAHAEEV